MRQRLAAWTLLALVVSVSPLAQSAPDFYQRALVEEHAIGDLRHAVALYTQALKAAGDDRELAVKALLRIAGCHEKLGDDEAAVTTYGEVVRGYPEQRPAVSAAQQRLDAIRDAGSTRKVSAGASVSHDAVATVVRPMVESYCVTCHGPGNRTGALDLSAASRAALGQNTAAWEAVLRRLRARRDPPPAAPRPDETTYRAAVTALESALDASYPDNRPLRPIERASVDELAARLATFLWNGEPDGALREAARRGDLQQPATLRQEVRRMLRDERSIGLIDGFFATWLSLDRLQTAGAASGADPALIQAMEGETRRFLKRQLHDDRDASELWTANYSFVNDTLARHYGLLGRFDSEFTRVTWPADSRAGLLGQAGILTALSLDGRTSPTVRGVYVLSRFLGIDPPAPPANVPPLPEVHGRQAGTMRDRILAHKLNPSCASCHAIFDPMGLALENFDELGRWRLQDGGITIDASGTFVDGARFDGAAELLAGLLRYREAYYSGVTERLLAYALNRKGSRGRVYDYEMPAVRAIVRSAAASGYQWSAILAGVASSDPFQALRIVP